MMDYLIILDEKEKVAFKSFIEGGLKRFLGRNCFTLVPKQLEASIQGS